MAYFVSNHSDPAEQDDKAPAAGRREGGPEPVSGHTPFDAHELERLPRPSADDPPYRDWWAVEGEER